MATVLSVGDVVRFDVAFVEQLLKKLAARRPAAPSFCLFVRSAPESSAAEQALFADLASGTVERAAQPAAVTLRFSAADLEATLQGRISDEDFMRRVDTEATPPSALAALFTALRPDAEAVPGQSHEVAGETIERRYASAGSDAMIDEAGRRVKGRPQSFKVKAAATAVVARAVIGAPRAGGDTHAFARDNLLRVLRPLATFASDQQADALRVVSGMASIKTGDEWSELGRLGD